MFWGGVSTDGDEFLDQPYLFTYGWLFNIINYSDSSLPTPRITATWTQPISGISASSDPSVTMTQTGSSAEWSMQQLAPQGQPGGGMAGALSTTQAIPAPYALGYDVTRAMLEGREVPAGATNVDRTFTMTFTAHDPMLSHLAASIDLTGGYQIPNPGPVSTSDVACTGGPDEYLRVIQGEPVFWKAGEVGFAPLVAGRTYTLVCTLKLTNPSPYPALFAPWIAVTGRRLAATVPGVDSVTYTSPGVGADPSDPLGTVTFDTGASNVEAVLEVGFNRTVMLNRMNAIVLGPPTLTASPITSVDGNVSISGTGAAGATITLFDGQMPFAGGISVDTSGNWATQRFFLVGSHPLSATQAIGGQTSAPSAIVTVHHVPPTPGINGPSSVISATSPATVTLTGYGFYGGGQTPPTGATVTIFEGSTEVGSEVGSAVVPQNGPWSATIQLAYGAHSLTAWQTLAGETSALSTAFVVTVSAPLGPPTLTASPTTSLPGTMFTISGTAVPGANVLLSDGANQVASTMADNSGNWMMQRSFIVGSHPLSATQMSGGQTSGPSSPAVTVHVVPPTPNITGPGTVTSATSPASVTLTGGAFYSPALGTGGTVTIFEGSTVLGSAVVLQNGPWSASITLAYGAHGLTASQTLAGETSALSPPFVVTVSAPIGPPTLTVTPTTSLPGTMFTISGTAVPGANVLLSDGANQVASTMADNSGNWTMQRSFIVGSHPLSATQMSGGQTSGPSSPAVTVHVVPPTPNITGPGTVTSATSPATFTLTGGGFYSSALGTGGTVTIFEGSTVLGSAVVLQNGPWSTSITLAYGAHGLTASQTLAGETSALSTPFVVTVSAPIGPPTLTVSPITNDTDGIFSISGTGVPNAFVSLFDAQPQPHFTDNIHVATDGTWSISKYLIVGTHTLSATQTIGVGGQTSGPSSSVTVYHVPSSPRINSPSSVTSATSPATVTLTGGGFYGAAQTPPTGSTVTIFEGPAPIGTAVVGPNGQWSTSVALAFGQHSLTASQTLAGLTSTLSPPFVVTVKDNTPPVLTLPPNMTVEATEPNGAHVTFTASANDATTGPAQVTCTPASGSLFPLGPTTVSCSASDAFGNVASGTFTVTVRDTTPPVTGTLTASPGVLWPPNHKMVSIALRVTASDTVTPAPVCRVVSVTSNEPLNGAGDGNTATDYTFSGVGLDLSLRAERSGTLTDRIYTVAVACKDTAGNDSLPKTVAVVVPHDQGKK